MSLGARLRKLREARGLTGRAAAVYLDISSAHVSDIEKDKANPGLELLSRLATYYRTSVDYLLGLTDDPSPRRSEPLPETVQEVVELMGEMSEARQAELVAHARVLAEAERAQDLRDYDRMMGLILALGGDALADEVEEALRADASGDRATALRLIDDIVARWRGRLPQSEVDQEPVEQG